MSRLASPPSTQTGNQQKIQIPHEKIAKRAYEKWCQRGMPHGTDVQNWLEAEAEIRAEMTRPSSTMGRR